MKNPYLVQRCELVGDGKIHYDYMGAAQFEWGDQAKSLKRFFAAGVAEGSVKIKVGEHEVVVHMIGPAGTTFEDYQVHLQQMVDDESKMHLHEWTCFGDAARKVAGVPPSTRYHNDRINAWFDFENDVIWTLTDDHRRELMAALDRIKTIWAEK